MPRALREPPAQKPRLRGVSHHYGFWISLPVGVLLVATAPAGTARLCAAVFAFGVSAMLGASALLHRGDWSAVHHTRLTQLDHTTIFLCIAGTYTPIAALGMDGWVRTVVLVAIWVGAATGIVLEWLPVNLPRGYVTAVYITLGWAGVIGMPQLWTNLGVWPVLGVIAGGLLYTVGAVIHAARSPDPWPAVFGYHEIWHVFVIAAASTHYAVIAFAVIPRG